VSGFHLGYSEIGLDLKSLIHCYPSFSISPQKRKRCREAAMGRRVSLVPLDSVFGRGNCLIETTEMDEGKAQSRESQNKGRIKRAYSNAPFKALDRSFGLSANEANPTR
jgi:hypothetical protein